MAAYHQATIHSHMASSSGPFLIGRRVDDDRWRIRYLCPEGFFLVAKQSKFLIDGVPYLCGHLSGYAQLLGCLVKKSVVCIARPWTFVVQVTVNDHLCDVIQEDACDRVPAASYHMIL
ncbi:MAG TPA: hypothetical protein DIT01_13810 [Lentisphaeria bacterium]|nr:hypothetical protein [Lentisphaeria bacterium]